MTSRIRATKIIDLGWPWTAKAHSVAEKMRVFAQIWMKIYSYYQDKMHANDYTFWKYKVHCYSSKSASLDGFGFFMRLNFLKTAAMTSASWPLAHRSRMTSMTRCLRHSSWSIVHSYFVLVLQMLGYTENLARRSTSNEIVLLAFREGLQLCRMLYGDLFSGQVVDRTNGEEMGCNGHWVHRHKLADISSSLVCRV